MATTVDILETQFRATGHNNVANAMRNVANVATTMSSGTMAAAGSMAAMATSVGVALAVVKVLIDAIERAAKAMYNYARYTVQTAGEFERLQARMNGVFGSAKAGEEAFEWAKDFAKRTPFSLEEVIQQMTTMRALGLDVARDFRTLADTGYALGLGADGIGRIVLQLGQMRAVGHATMMDLRPLMQAGVPVLDILQEKLSLTPKQLENIGNARIPASKVIDAIMEGLNDRFAGGTQRATETLAGQMNNLGDNFRVLAAQIGQFLLPAVKSIVSAINDFMTDQRITDAVTVVAVAFNMVADAALSVAQSMLAVAEFLFSFLSAITLGATAALAEGAREWNAMLGRLREGISVAVASGIAQMILNRRAAKIAPMAESAAAASGESSLVERFILGGGERLRRGAGGLDIARKMLPGGPPVVTIRVEAGDNSPLAKAIEGIAQKVSTVTLSQLLNDPRGRAALKGALAG